MEKREFTFVWEGIAIDVAYTPDYSPAFGKIYGWTLAHLSIKRQGKGQIPISETGYKSHFTNAANIEEMGGPETYVQEWLNEEKSSEAWQSYIAKARQLTLF